MSVPKPLSILVAIAAVFGTAAPAASASTRIDGPWLPHLPDPESAQIAGGNLVAEDDIGPILNGRRPFGLWRMNLRTHKRKWLLRDNAQTHFLDTFTAEPQKLFTVFVSNGKAESALWSDDEVTLSHPIGDPIRSLITFREYQTKGGRTCGEDVVDVTSSRGDGYIVKTLVPDQEALVGAGCVETGDMSRSWHTYFRWYSESGLLERVVRFRHLDPATDPQLFGAEDAVLDDSYSRWRVTDLTSGRSRTFKTTRDFEDGAYVEGGSDRSVTAMKTLRKRGRDSLYALVRYPNPLKSRRSINLVATHYKDLEFDYCGRAIVYMNSSKTRLYRWDPRTHSTRLIARTPTNRNMYNYVCDAKGAVIWLEDGHSDEPAYSRAQYVRF